MKNTRQNNCDDVVELLVKKYWSESKNELDQKIAQIAQDFINRGLHNNTARISKQLHTEFEYLQKLIEYIFESLKQDFSHIPLATCKNKLFTVVDSEYKKLIPITTSRLVKANLGQKDILEQYKKGIIGEMEKAKAKIEIQCALLEKGKAAASDKGYDEKSSKSITLKAAKITFVAAVITLIGAVLTSPLWVPIINKIFGDSGESTKILTQREISEDSSAKAISSDPNNLVPIDHNDPGSKKMQTEPSPITSKDEELIRPEETEGDVNQPKISPLFKIPERTIAPEENAGEVNEPKKPELIKRKEKQIEPADQ